MKAVIQRVFRSSVSVNSECISSIGRGLTVLIGIHRDDTAEDIEYIVRKVLNLRLFEDEGGKRWNKSVMDEKLEVLCVSQFTLYYKLKGNRPDFSQAMKAEESRVFYEKFLERMKQFYQSEKIKDGKFGAMMEVDIANDGPVTIEIESPAMKSRSENGSSVEVVAPM